MIDRNLLSIKLLALTNINKGGVDAKKSSSGKLFSFLLIASMSCLF